MIMREPNCQSEIIARLPSCLQVYCKEKGLWEASTPLSSGRRRFTAMVIEERVYVMGGENEDGMRHSPPPLLTLWVQRSNSCAVFCLLNIKDF